MAMTSLPILLFLLCLGTNLQQAHSAPTPSSFELSDNLFGPAEEQEN